METANEGSGLLRSMSVRLKTVPPQPLSEAQEGSSRSDSDDEVLAEIKAQMDKEGDDDTSMRSVANELDRLTSSSEE